MKIYTKTGDNGIAGLQGGIRVFKSDLRIIAYGAVDEVNSHLGLILAYNIDADIKIVLTKIQQELFIVGSDLSNPDITVTKNRVSESMVLGLEKDIDKFESEISPLANFILPGGNKIAALFHIARTITRRAETNVVALAQKETINLECQKYLNRLSDLLFVLARVCNKRSNNQDTIWKPSE